MMTQLTQGELWAFNILNNQVQNVQAELQRGVSAREAFIKLLEVKYKAKFDPATGTLEPKKEE